MAQRALLLTGCSLRNLVAGASRNKIHDACKPIGIKKCTSKLFSVTAVQNKWKVNMLYDSECPLCVKEVNFLTKRNKNDTLKFTDIAKLDYNPEENGNIDYETGMRKIHAILHDGQVLKGVAVFQKVYEEVGLGWVYSFMKIPLLANVAEKVYDKWAEQRMWIAGRPELEAVFASRREILKHMKDQNEERSFCDSKKS